MPLDTIIVRKELNCARVGDGQSGFVDSLSDSLARHKARKQAGRP